MLRIAVVPPRRDCSATITALVLSAGMPEGTLLVHRPANWLSPLRRSPDDWPALVEVLHWKASLGRVLDCLDEIDGPGAILFEPGGLGRSELERLQRHVDLIAITCRPGFDDEMAALIGWKVLEAARARRGHRAVPVILPVDQLPRDAGDGGLEAARRFRGIGERTIDVPPRIVPPTLPPLPRRFRDPLVFLDAGGPHPLIAQVGRRLYRGLEVLAEDPDIAWPDFQERWRAIDAATPLPAMPWARHARLAEDLAGYAVTGGPDEAELAAAPYLDFWAEIWRPAPVLTGIVRGHPSIANDRPIVTSDLITMDAAAGWARTLSRLYRLGSPQQSEADTEPTQH